MVPASYEESRRCFCEQLTVFQRTWPSAVLENHALSGHKDVSIDWIQVDARKRRENLLVISTGLHGIEGYVGAAVLQLFIDEFLARINADMTGVLVIHSINPWGMRQRERINSNNVDLNRNFVEGEFQSPALENPDYAKLKTFLCPDHLIRNLTKDKLYYIAGLVKTIILVGASRLREATLMGQYDFPPGIYFGGQMLQEETRTMMDLYRNAFKVYERIIHIDLHSGYGPRDQMTVVTSPLEGLSSEEIQAKYHLGRVAGANPDEFYSMHGDMNDWEYRLVRTEYPDASIFAVNFEFGTYGKSFLAEARSLRITILKNQKNQYGASKSTGEWIDNEYHELYLPQDPAWYDKVWQDARRAFQSILTVEGCIT